MAATLQPLLGAAYRRIVVLTGAGVSVASGLPTYRGAGGLWTGHPELADRMTAAGLLADPGEVWRVFGPLREQVRTARPNPAHLALATFETALPSSSAFTLITQNVDGLHARAGSRNLVELHGRLARTRCPERDCTLAPFDDASAHLQGPPPCPVCGRPLRPDVVLFGEAIPVDAEWAAKKALRGCDLFVAAGTSGTVWPAASFVRSAEYEGARTIYVNPEPLDPPVPAFQQTILGRAEEVLPELLRA